MSRSNDLSSRGRRTRRVRPFLGRFAGLVLFAAAAVSPASAEESFFGRFIDPEDNHFDLSEWLDRGGFLPVPIILSEPAVDNGLGIAAVFLSSRAEDDPAPPNATGIAALHTGNQSRLFAAFHRGFYLQDRLRYLGGVGTASINLDFYPAGSDTGISYNIDGAFTLQNVRYRLGGSSAFAGLRWVYLDSDVSFDLGTNLPPEVPALRFSTKLSGIGPTLYFDNRDNIFTPQNGVQARLAVTRFDGAWGSDLDYTSAQLAAFGYVTPDSHWTFSGKGVIQSVGNNAPFFAQPFIDLRGIPAARYQAETAVSTELEVTYAVTPRWRVLGFGGVGWAADGGVSLGQDTARAIYGAGVRYRISRKLGFDVGFDVARGPEETVVYLQVGHAWQID